MTKLTTRPDKAELVHDRDEPNPLVALAVGLIYLFRTRPGLAILRELDAAVRKYAANPAALWRLVRTGEQVLDTTAVSSSEKSAENEEKILLHP